MPKVMITKEQERQEKQKLAINRVLTDHKCQTGETYQDLFERMGWSNGRFADRKKDGQDNLTVKEIRELLDATEYFDGKSDSDRLAFFDEVVGERVRRKTVEMAPRRTGAGGI